MGGVEARRAKEPGGRRVGRAGSKGGRARREREGVAGGSQRERGKGWGGGRAGGRGQSETETGDIGWRACCREERREEAGDKGKGGG